MCIKTSALCRTKAIKVRAILLGNGGNQKQICYFVWPKHSSGNYFVVNRDIDGVD